MKDRHVIEALGNAKVTIEDSKVVNVEEIGRASCRERV